MAGWFSQRLLQQVFGWDDLAPCPPRPIEAALFPITHQAFGGAVPVVLTGLANDELDRGQVQFGQDGRRRSPHSCLQECLNADDSSNWGLLCNGTSLRLLHASRFQRNADNTCLLDGWKQAGQQSGERALNKLRDGVQAALEAVGQGLLQHPANGELVAKLQSGELSTQAFFRQLLRLVYRLLFLCVSLDTLSRSCPIRIISGHLLDTAGQLLRVLCLDHQAARRAPRAGLDPGRRRRHIRELPPSGRYLCPSPEPPSKRHGCRPLGLAVPGRCCSSWRLVSAGDPDQDSTTPR